MKRILASLCVIALIGCTSITEIHEHYPLKPHGNWMEESCKSYPNSKTNNCHWNT